ncbi:glycosyltransferase family 4 protein [Nostocoides veronense]|uniref:D-inositol 3-phosphate glycosyltransferase n=1 Tax=Nostocoides veronense TaxID=330836 RepID=A0ABN2LHF7_9MICO
MSPRRTRRILLAVTSTQSLRLLAGFPEYLARSGWDVHVVCSNPPSDQIIAGCTVHEVHMRREPSPMIDLVSFVRWVWLLSRLRPDLVVAGTPKAGLLGMVAAALLRVPLRVYMLRGLRLSTETGRRRQILALIERLTVWASTHVQAVSFSLRDEFVAAGLAPANKVIVVGHGSSNGVTVPREAHEETAKEARQRLGLPPARTVGFVGRMHPDKGITTLLEALHFSSDSPRWQALLIGPEDQPGFLDQQLSALPPSVRKRVVYIGEIPDPSTHYGAMDLLALPTLREGFPNVVLEAAVHGTPTVASDVTGCRDAVVDGVTGLLVRPSDPRALADAIERVLSNPSLRDRLGLRARERVSHHFRREDVWQLTADLYSSLHTNCRSGA